MATPDPIREIATIGTWSAGDAPVTSPVGQIGTAFSAAQLTLRDYQAKVIDIDSDADLSETGKAKAKRKVAEAALAKIIEHKARIPSFRKERDKLLDQRIVEPDGWRKVLDFMAETEVRRALAEVDPLEREVILREAAAAGDREILQAVKNAPRFKPLAPPELIAELEAAQLEAARPDTAREVAAYDRAIAEAEGALTGAEQHIRAAAGLETDPLQEFVKGNADDDANSEARQSAAE